MYLAIYQENQHNDFLDDFSDKHHDVPSTFGKVELGENSISTATNIDPLEITTDLQSALIKTEPSVSSLVPEVSDILAPCEYSSRRNSASILFQEINSPQNSQEQATDFKLPNKYTDPLVDQGVEATKSLSTMTNTFEDHEALPKSSYWYVFTYKYNKTVKYFIGQVMKLHANGTLDAKFVRRLKGSKNIFVWPDIDDEDRVPYSCIVKMLNEPDINRRGQLTFNDIQDMLIE